MSTNPYADPAATFVAPTAAPVRPGGVTLVGVLAIVLGVMGIFGGCGGAAALLLNPLMQGALQPPPGAPPFQRAQAELNAEIMGVNQNHMIPLSISLVGLTVVAIWLTVGGIQTLRMRPQGRVILLYGFLATILFEVVRSGHMLVMQLEMLPIYEEFRNRIAREISDRSQLAGLQTMLNLMQAAVIFGIVIGIGWVVIKVVVYGLCARYLSKPEIIDKFENGPHGNASAPSGTPA